MSERKLLTAFGAYKTVKDLKHVPPTVSSFVCPYPKCRAYAAHAWGVVRILAAPTPHGVGWTNRNPYHGQTVWFAQCAVCQQEVLFLDDAMIWPNESEAPTPDADMPKPVADDFEEARQIYMRSPRGAAALLRLALQKLLKLLDVPGDINQGIGKLVEEGKISPTIQQALDAVRVIGNEAVHPGTLDLKDDQETALRLFKLLNFIVEKTISDPKRIAEIYGTLPPEKLKGIEDRDKKAVAAKPKPVA